MKMCIKITSFIIVMSALVVFSKQIQNEIVERYNNSVEQLASLTMTNTNPLGF
nr:hypothetical protein [uncultured Psychroserpens sp.]